MSDWQEFPWQPDEPDAHHDRLCSGRGRDLSCELEGATFAQEPPPPKDEIVVWAYNVERGLRLDDQLRTLKDPGMPPPDIVLLNEADRGCTRSGYRNVAREWARALGMYYLYGTEFIELPRIIGPGGRIARRCEHGNAILSRYPLGNTRLIRHADSRDWNSALQRLFFVGEPRLGGRVAVAADARIGDRLLRIYSVHFESGLMADHFRRSQVGELIDDAAQLPHGVIIGGDTNAGSYIEVLKGEKETEPVSGALIASGYADAHADLPVEARITTDSHVVIDLVFGKGVQFGGSGVGPRVFWGGLSDHLPVWAKVKVAS